MLFDRVSMTDILTTYGLDGLEHLQEFPILLPHLYFLEKEKKKPLQ